MDNRKLGWIAIGLGVVALLVALGGRARPMGWYNDGPRFSQSVPAAPAAPPAPQAPQGPRQWVGPQGDAPHGFGQQWAGPRGKHDFGPGWGGPHRGGFFIFKLFGGLLRSVLFLLILFLLVRWFARRKNQTPPPSSPSGPGPEQPPYTGGTQAL